MASLGHLPGPWVHASNFFIIVRVSAWRAFTGNRASACASTSATKWRPLSAKRRIRARWPPSTRTFTVPSGSFSSCSTTARVPTSKRSAAPRIVAGAVAPRHQENAFVRPHRRVEGDDGRLGADEERMHTVRINHHVAQWQHRHFPTTSASLVTPPPWLDSSITLPSFPPAGPPAGGWLGAASLFGRGFGALDVLVHQHGAPSRP